MPASTGANGDHADEHTGLLNGDANNRRRSTLYELFLNKHHTPGMDSDNKLVRWPARGFNVTKVTLLSNYVNVLLIFVPLGIIAGAGGWNPTVVFILNFFAIVPLAAVLSFATEEISVKLGETMGGLLNATFGNAVELIVCAHKAPGRMKLTLLGQHCRIEEWGDQNRSVEHVGKHPLEYSVGSRLLLFGRRHS